MQQYKCGICIYVYDPAKEDPAGNIPPDLAFTDAAEDWICPVCGAENDQFVPMA